jgi:thiol-disulfide isomerase/thioredoxin
MPIVQNAVATRDDLARVLRENTSVVIMKFGADWCGPCKKIESTVHDFMSKMPEQMLCTIIDIDECFDVYAFLKSKKIVNGIPALVAYYKGNVHYAPDEVVIGTDTNEIRDFFVACKQAHHELQ